MTMVPQSVLQQGRNWNTKPEGRYTIYWTHSTCYGDNALRDSLLAATDDCRCLFLSTLMYSSVRKATTMGDGFSLTAEHSLTLGETNNLEIRNEEYFY